MATYTKRVHKVFPKSKGGRTWLGIVTDGKDGGEREENVFDDAVKAVFSAGPGIYELSYEKKDKFWNLVAAKVVKADGNGAPVQAAPAKSSAPVDDTKVVRATVYAAALNAATLLTLANKGKLDEDALIVKVRNMTAMFIRHGAEIVANGLKAPQVVTEPEEPAEEPAEVEGA